MQLVEWLGIVAGAFTTGSLLPQVIRIYRLKSAHEISLLFNILFFAGTVLWLIYGSILGHPPIILWNSVAVVFVLALLVGKIRYGKK